jgi:PAS domain S-box-containing protein
MQKGGGSDQYEVLSNRVENAVEQYRTQQQFWDALSWYQRLVEQNIAGVFVVQGAKLAYVNQKFAEIFESSQSELIGEPATVFVAAEHEDEVSQLLTTTAESECETFQKEVTGQRRDGEAVAVEVHGGPVEYNGEKAVLGILRDLSREG